MTVKRILTLALLVAAFFSSACMYIVLPEDLATPEAEHDDGTPKTWTALATKVEQSASGDLRIDLTIRNDTGDWSTLQTAGKPAVLTAQDGKKTDCETVFVSTGGHRLAPGFQMRGYTTLADGKQQPQMLYVECKGAAATPGSTLAIDTIHFDGELDDYKPDENKQEGTLEINLDEIAADLTYPVAVPVDGLLHQVGEEIPALSENVVTLLDAKRQEPGFSFTWQNFNPTKFPLTTHIGIPPVIGKDGIIYGVYETLDMAPVPLTPAKDKVQWTTEATVPTDGAGFYILLSVESKKPRTYLFYAIDISDR